MGHKESQKGVKLQADCGWRFKTPSDRNWWEIASDAEVLMFAVSGHHESWAGAPRSWANHPFSGVNICVRMQVRVTPGLSSAGESSL